MSLVCRCTTVTLHALGAAIPLCLSLALAIRDALPGGEPPDPLASCEDPADSQDIGNVKMDVVTGSKVVHDEVTPEDEVCCPFIAVHMSLIITPSGRRPSLPVAD